MASCMAGARFSISFIIYLCLLGTTSTSDSTESNPAVSRWTNLQTQDMAQQTTGQDETTGQHGIKPGQLNTTGQHDISGKVESTQSSVTEQMFATSSSSETDTTERATMFQTASDTGSLTTSESPADNIPTVESESRESNTGYPIRGNSKDESVLNQPINLTRIAAVEPEVRKENPTSGTHKPDVTRAANHTAEQLLNEQFQSTEQVPMNSHPVDNITQTANESFVVSTLSPALRTTSLHLNSSLSNNTQASKSTQSSTNDELSASSSSSTSSSSSSTVSSSSSSLSSASSSSSSSSSEASLSYDTQATLIPNIVTNERMTTLPEPHIDNSSQINSTERMTTLPEPHVDYSSQINSTERMTTLPEPPTHNPTAFTPVVDGTIDQPVSRAMHTVSQINHDDVTTQHVTSEPVQTSEPTETPDTVDESDEQRLLNDLFESYNSNARPVRSSSTAVNISIVYFLLSLQQMDEREQIMQAFGWIGMYWKDEFLTWDKAEYGGISELIVGADQVWTPDIVIWNSADKMYGDDLFDTSLYKLSISPDGSVWYYVAGSTQTFCDMNLRTFPFDVQTCFIRLLSWTYPISQLNMTAMDPVIDTSTYQENGQWELHTTQTVSRKNIIDGIPYSGVRFVMNLKRKPLFYLVTFTIPCVLLSLIVLFVFLLPADAGEKVGLSITVLLSFGVFQLMLIGYMPASSDYTPLITVYVIYVVILSTLSLLFTVLILVLTYKDGTEEPPKWLRKLAFGCMAKVTCKERCCFRKKEPIADLNLIKFATSRDPKTILGSNGFGLESNGTVGSNSDFPDVWLCEKREQPSKRLGSKSVFTVVLRPLTTSLANKLGKSKEENPAKEEWLEIARLFDRLLLLLFFIATITIIIVVFAIAPNVDNDFRVFNNSDIIYNTKG